MDEHLQRAVLHHQLEGAREQEIADQHGGLVAEHRVGRGQPAAQQALVHHVVVQQRGGVDELDAGGELDVPRVALADSRTAAREASVSSGRSRLPPAATMCAASCGISATGLSIRATMVRLHASRSGCSTAARAFSASGRFRAEAPDCPGTEWRHVQAGSPGLRVWRPRAPYRRTGKEGQARREQ